MTAIAPERWKQLLAMLRHLVNSNAVKFHTDGVDDALFHLYENIWLDSQTATLVWRKTPLDRPESMLKSQMANKTPNDSSNRP